MNDIPQITTSSSVPLFADDTKCYRAIRTTEDVKHLQCDLDGINEWCQTWRMNLNQSKCGLLSVTRNRKKVLSSYHLTNYDPTNTSIINKRTTQKDLGVLITTDLTWNHQISAVCTKANKMLQFVKRSTVRTPRIFNSLPPNIRGSDVTIGQFKSYLLKYYHKMTELVYDFEVPQTFKTVCLKCHSCRPLSSLADKMCCK